MRFAKITLSLLALPVLGAVAAAETEALPFTLPTPEGWRTETLPFPLEFAPDLPYTGLEELRFAPGMFDEQSDELWSYAFVWWVALDEPSDAASLGTHLESYFRGLAAAVAESREIAVDEDASFSTSIATTGETRFAGSAETFDAFVTRGQIRLNVSGEILRCPDRQAIFFALSPQPDDHTVWEALDSIRAGFRCEPTPASS